jgi:hypothetical protein
MNPEPTFIVERLREKKLVSATTLEVYSFLV